LPHTHSTPHCTAHRRHTAFDLHSATGTTDCTPILGQLHCFHSCPESAFLRLRIFLLLWLPFPPFTRRVYRFCVSGYRHYLPCAVHGGAFAFRPVHVLLHGCACLCVAHGSHSRCVYFRGCVTCVAHLRIDRHAFRAPPQSVFLAFLGRHLSVHFTTPSIDPHRIPRFIHLCRYGLHVTAGSGSHPDRYVATTICLVGDTLRLHTGWIRGPASHQTTTAILVQFYCLHCTRTSAHLPFADHGVYAHARTYTVRFAPRTAERAFLFTLPLDCHASVRWGSVDCALTRTCFHFIPPAVTCTDARTLHAFGLRFSRGQSLAFLII